MHKISTLLQTRVAKLPLRLVGSDRDGIGEVQAASLAPGGNANNRARVIAQEFHAKAASLVSKDQHRVVPVVNLRKGSGRLAGEEDYLRGFEGSEKIVDPLVNLQVKKVPVVESRPADRLLRYVKAERTNEVKLRAESRAGSSDVSGILGNLRLNERYLHA